MRKLFSIILFNMIFFNSCSYPELTRDELIYSNNFEDNKLDEIDGGVISEYNNNRVIGNFNNSGFTLHVNNLGKHDFIYITFDLYIHGSWDGNSNGFNPKDHGFEDQPDLWIMDLRPEMVNFQSLDFQRFQTTFSNSPCFPTFCLKQSYPNSFPFTNNPKTSAQEINLTENCVSPGWNNQKTSLYKVEKGFDHSGNSLIVRFHDKLFQPNAINAQGESIAKCDESWSMDNIKIRVIAYD